MRHLHSARPALLCLAVSGLILQACSRQPAPALQQQSAPAQPQAAAAPAAVPAGQPARPAEPAGASSPQNPVATVTGTVAETMDASNYTYVRVKTGKGDVWAASARFKVAVGDRVTVPLEMPMEQFHSPSLNRDFPLIYFASEITPEGEAPATPALPGASMMTPAHGGPGAPSAPAPLVGEVIAPPPGGMTIAEVWQRRASLAGRTATVAGRVVKFNGGILNRNWVHIQDGSGAAKEGTNDLLVTTGDVARVGDVVTATGKIAVDQDFGAGYAYKVLLEAATVRRK
jgi:hypothetical protein